MSDTTIIELFGKVISYSDAHELDAAKEAHIYLTIDEDGTPVHVVIADDAEEVIGRTGQVNQVDAAGYDLIKDGSRRDKRYKSPVIEV